MSLQNERQSMWTIIFPQRFPMVKPPTKPTVYIICLWIPTHKLRKRVVWWQWFLPGLSTTWSYISFFDKILQPVTINCSGADGCSKTVSYFGKPSKSRNFLESKPTIRSKVATQFLQPSLGWLLVGRGVAAMRPHLIEELKFIKGLRDSLRCRSVHVSWSIVYWRSL
jgi:hypothetical protein